MENMPFLITPSNESKQYYSITHGSCEGYIIGGNLCTFNLLQGTEFMPDLKDKIIFLEDDNICGEYFTGEFDRNLQSLIQTTGFSGVKGIVFGSFDDSCKLDLQTITRIVKSKKQLQNIPVAFNVDFGHVFPLVTFPIGGTANLCFSDKNVEIEIVSH